MDRDNVREGVPKGNFGKCQQGEETKTQVIDQDGPVEKLRQYIRASGGHLSGEWTVFKGRNKRYTCHPPREFVPANGQEKQDSYAGLTGVARAMGLKPHGTCTTLGEKRERPAKRQLRQRAAKRQRQDPIDGEEAAVNADPDDTALFAWLEETFFKGGEGGNGDAERSAIDAALAGSTSLTATADAAMACPDVWPNVATGVHPSIVAMAEQIRTCGCSASTCTVLAELLQMDATKQQIEAERQHMQARLQAAEESVQSHQAVVEQLRAGLAAAEEAAQKQLEELFSCQAETEQLRAAVDEMSGSCLQQLGLGEKLLELMDEVEHAQIDARERSKLMGKAKQLQHEVDAASAVEPNFSKDSDSELTSI